MTTDTTAIAPSYLDQIELPDDLPDIRLDPPKLNWYHGVDAGKFKTPGVFYGKQTMFGDVPPPPWEVDERYADQGELGFSAALLRLAFIGWREQWFIPGETDEDVAVWLRDGERVPEGTRIKKQIDYLVLIDGLPDAMVLSVSGFYKSRPIESIIREYEVGALAQEIRRRKRRLPRWTHWLTIGSKVDDKDKPIVEPAKDAAGKEYGSNVTPPILRAAPELLSEADFMRAIDAWNLYNSLGWFKFRRLPANTVEGQIVERPALPAPTHRNIPQPIEDIPEL